jgi:hypothetical protein
MLKLIDLDQARFSVGERERSRTDSRLLGSSVDHPTICRLGEEWLDAPSASYAATPSLLQKAAHAVWWRGSGVAISSGPARPKTFPSIQPFSRSPDTLAAMVVVGDWNFFAFAAPALGERTEDTSGRAIGAMKQLKLTRARQERFLKALADTGSVTTAVATARTSRTRVYELPEDGPCICRKVGGGRGDRDR